MTRRRRFAAAFRPLPLPASRGGRRSLATSVSLFTLAVAGLTFAQPLLAQNAPAPSSTLPGTTPLQGGRWVGARMPTVAQGNNGLVMTIKQEQERALLDWQRFDIGATEEVVFDQQNASWIALNRIFDSKPSEIAGKITAKGQVWLQNTNGIIFRNGAQINAHSIVATALPISEAQLNTGLLSGRGVLRGTTTDPLFSSVNRALVAKPYAGLDPNVLLGTVTVAGETVQVIDLLARAAVRMAVLRDNDMKGTDVYNGGWGLDQIPGAPVNWRFSANGLSDVMEALVAQVDLSKLGDYRYEDFTNVASFWQGVSWQGIPPGSQVVPQGMRTELAAQIKTQFVDNYATLVATAQQKYDNYVANSRVTVERGATLTALSSDTASPGKIMLFGPNVTNAGKLVAHDGQVLMAAGEMVKLGAGQNYTNSVRGGLAVNVSASPVVDSAGTFPNMPCCRPETYAAWDGAVLERTADLGMAAVNSGEILADRGAVVLAGARVDQMGKILVTNGVRQRTGSIVLQASHGFNMSEYSVGGNYWGGSLTLGENSVTRITPDLSNLTGLAADTFAKGRILLAGTDILLDRNAEVTSRSGDVVIHANPTGAGARGGNSPAAEETIQEKGGDPGSFTMRTGARIDVSGLTNVERSVADNVFAVEIRSNEVSASPRQRDGILIGETVYVDRRDGATIVDWTGALAGEQRTALQMSTEGGNVQIRASNFAVIENGATIDVSGGSTRYTDAEVKVTRLRDSFGRFHNIANADPNLRYTGIDQSIQLMKGYVEGADAGQVEILSGSARLFGKLKGDVIIGAQQALAAIGQIRAPRTPVGAVGADFIVAPKMPTAGAAILHRGGPEYGAWTSRNLFITADEQAFTGTVYTQIESNGPYTSETMLLDPSLIGQDWSEYEGTQLERLSFVEDDFFSGMGEVQFGFGSSHQGQTINSGVSIRLAPGGSFSLGGENGKGTVGDNVTIVAPSGKISLSAADGMTMGTGGYLSVAAPWVNDADAAANVLRGYVDGGEITLFGVKLSEDLTLDAGGGGWNQLVRPATPTAAAEYALVGGKGGDILLGSNGMSVGGILDVVDINLGGLAGGGLLSLMASGDVVIGPDGGSKEGFEYLDQNLFRDMGVGSLQLGATTMRVLSGANLLFQSRNLMFDGRAADVATGTDLRDVTSLVLLPAHQRQGGALVLSANSIAIEKGALVEVDPLGRINLSGSRIEIDGTVRARGGQISVGHDYGLTGGMPVGFFLGDTALLDATGIAQTIKVPGGADGRGFWYDGRIVKGGSVSVDGDYIEMAPGATIDVSGTSGLLSVWQSGRFSLLKVNQTVGSDAGTISLQAGGGYLLGRLRGEAGSVYNYGGTLSIGGGQDGNLLVPGYSDWQTGTTGLESILEPLQWYFYPSPEAPASLRQYFADNAPWMEQQLGFGPNDIEDIQFSSVEEFQNFLRIALAPIVQKDPKDVAGAFILDPTLTAMPDVPPPSGGQFVVPEGYTPESAEAFDRAMKFVLQAFGNIDSAQLVRGSQVTAGANILNDMRTFDTLGMSGKLESDHAIDISSKRTLFVGGGFNGTNDMSFTSRNIYIGGTFPPNSTLMAEKTSGTLTIKGETVEFTSKFEVGGFEKVVVEAQGDMRGGYGINGEYIAPDSQLTPGINTTADLVLRAAQIYPTTGGVLQFNSTSGIRVEQTGRREAPLSAGGLLILNAPKIEQAGTLRAPFGEIRLTATGVTTTAEDGTQTYTPGTVDLFDRSITSTSADGRTILYGYTYDGQSWFSPTAQPGAGTAELNTPPEKRVSLTGDNISVREGALIDVSGNGDVLGLEFVAGPLGQSNVLDEPGVYAIVPAFGNNVIAPIDPLYNRGSTDDKGIGLGSQVWLAAFDGHAAGWYTLLPAEYALTPGGYRINLLEGKPSVADARVLGDESFAVMGRQGLIGTSIVDQTMSTFRVERGADVRKRSEFFETYGNSFFSSERFLEGLRRSGNPYNADPRLPVDGGFLTLAANSSLELDGTIVAAGLKGARGGVVDITSDNIVIAAPGTDVSDLVGYLVLDPTKISNIAESLLIGGIRRQGAGGLEVVVGQTTRVAGEERSPEKSVGAENVVIRTNAANPLTGTELLFAANQSVRVESGAVVRATGDGADAVNLAIAPSMPLVQHPWDPSQSAPPEDWGGAFLRVSNLGDITVSRTNVQSRAGDMIVEAGAVLEATDAILLDSTQNTIVGNGATLKAGAISAAAGLVSLGAAPAGTEGLVFAGATLDALTRASKMTLKSYSTIDFYGDVTLDLTGAVTLDGAAFVDRGTAPGTVKIGAKTLDLRNSDGAAFDAIGTGGSIAFTAENIVIGEGEVDFAFAQTGLNASQRIMFDGLGESHFDGAATLNAAEVTGTSGAGHQIVAEGALKLGYDGTTRPTLSAFASSGALLDFKGTSVDMTNAALRAGSGTIRATATTGNVTVGAGSMIEVDGSDVSFFEVAGFLPGGSVQLISDAGNVVVAQGATINISGGDAGGDAGSLVLTAGRGVAELDGTIKAVVANGYRGGAFSLTTSTLENFGALNAMLNTSGFSRSRDFAILDGDVTLNGTTRVDALRIVTGTGDIRVAADAVIGSDSAKGGSILLASGGDLVVLDGARLDVAARGTDERGGTIDLQVALNGSIDVGSAIFNVAGTGKGGSGQVRLRAPQQSGDVAVARWGATVNGGGTQLEAFRVYDLADADGDAENGFLAEIDTALQQQVIADATAFMTANGSAIRGRLGQTGNSSFQIVPGIELRSEGDLDLVHNWNFKDARFDGQGGVLTLRAGGDLTINANLSDGFKNAFTTVDGIYPNIPEYGWMPGDYELEPTLEDKFTNNGGWSYNLVAGADFAQTNVLATQSGSDGSVEVGGLVRTGTGDINVAAGGNLNYEQPANIRFVGEYNAGTRITLPAGTPILDGTVMKPTTYRAANGNMVTRYPALPAGTVLREGTMLPAGTEMPDGSTLAVDTVLTQDVTLTSETTFPGDVVISGKTRLGSEMVWLMAGQPGSPNSPTAMGQQRAVFSIPGIGDVEVRQGVGGMGENALRLMDGRMIPDRNTVNPVGGYLVEMLNGAIYTVGVEDAPVPNYVEKNHVGYVNNNQAGIIIDQTWRTGGGDIAVNVGGSVIGAGTIVENTRWMLADGATPGTTQYGYSYPGKDPNAPFNSEPVRYQPDNTGQTTLSLIADRFKQGIGALGGGDVTITAGGDVDNMLVALPAWVRVSGGTTQSPTKTLHLSGGGDLVMNVGQNLLGGVVQLGKGRAAIDVAGSVMATEQRFGSLSNPANGQYLHLAIDDVQLSLQAGGDITLRGFSSSLGITDRPRWLGYTEDTSVRVTSLGGDIHYLASAGAENAINILPSQSAFVATAGSIELGSGARIMVDMWKDTRLDLLAQQDINFRLPGSYDGAGLTIGFADPLWVPRAINPFGENWPQYFQSTIGQDSLTGFWNFNQAGPGFGIDGPNIHNGSSSYSRIYAAQGDLTGWSIGNYEYQPGNGMHGGSYTFGQETRLKAGGDIRMGQMIFITHDGADVSTVEAGGAIYLPDAVLYGPGRLWVQAGDEIWMGNKPGAGIRAREATSLVSTAVPLSGGNVSVLAGIDQAPEYEAFFDYYLNPEKLESAPTWLRQYFVDGDRPGLTVPTDVVLKDGTTKVSVYAIELVNYMRGLNGQELIPTEAPDEVSGSRPITRGKLAAQIDAAEYAAALEAFQALDPVLQRPLAVRILNAELKTAGREAVGRSPETDGRYVRQGDPTRGYDAVGRLFPGAQRKPGDKLAEGEHTWTGNIEMVVGQIRGESGGDVDIVAPGGSVQLASLSISNTSPSNAGVITQRGGSVNAVVYGDYIVNQSRTMTADDGDILIWSSYGNIDAGRGRKTSLSVPPVAFPIDAWGTTRIQLSGLPNGAGIATLDQVDGKQGGDVDLYAFNGIVNAGDAGIRASRDLFVGAIEIRGLDNITVGGETNVDLGTDEGSVGALNVENFAQAMEDEAIAQAFDMSEEVEKLRTVRQTILTGSVVSFGIEGDDEEDEDEGE